MAARDGNQAGGVWGGGGRKRRGRAAEADKNRSGRAARGRGERAAIGARRERAQLRERARGGSCARRGHCSLGRPRGKARSRPSCFSPNPPPPPLSVTQTRLAKQLPLTLPPQARVVYFPLLTMALQNCCTLFWYFLQICP